MWTFSSSGFHEKTLQPAHLRILAQPSLNSMRRWRKTRLCPRMLPSKNQNLSINQKVNRVSRCSNRRMFSPALDSFTQNHSWCRNRKTKPNTLETISTTQLSSTLVDLTSRFLTTKSFRSPGDSLVRRVAIWRRSSKIVPGAWTLKMWSSFACVARVRVSRKDQGRRSRRNLCICVWVRAFTTSTCWPATSCKNCCSMSTKSTRDTARSTERTFHRSQEEGCYR